MADIKQIHIRKTDVTYDIKDEVARQQIATKQDAISNVSVNYQEDGGSPDASAQFENGTLAISMKNMKMKFSELTEEEKAEITGPQGIQGDSAVYNPDDPDTPDFEMANTTGQSTTKAMTQKAVTDEIDSVKWITEEIFVNSASANWQTGNISNGKIVTTYANKYIVFDNPSQVESVSFARGESSYTLRLFGTSDGTNYVAVGSAVSGGGTLGYNDVSGYTKLLLLLWDKPSTEDAQSETITLYGRHHRIDVIEQDLEELTDKVITPIGLDTNVPLVNYFISTSTGAWTNGQDSWKTKLVPISEYRGLDITIAKNPNGACRYAFLTDDYISANMSPHYCIGRGLVDVSASASPKKDTVPYDANYIALYAYSTPNDVTPSVTIELNALKMLEKEIFVETSSIDISQYNVENCSLGGSSKWYMSGNGLQRHVAIPVTPGMLIQLQHDNAAANASYAFLASYAPPYANNDTIPYVSGTGRAFCNAHTISYIIIPNGCTYLALTTVDGNNASFTWAASVGYWTTVPVRIPDNVAPISKLRILHWNVGHFSLGATYDTLVTHEDYAEMRQKWATKINDINADICLLCEYNTNFVNAEDDLPAITARSSVFALYKYAYVGTKPSSASYMQTAIYGNYEMKNVVQVTYPNTTQAGRYYQVGTLEVGDKAIKVVETHLDWNQGDSGATNRALQMQKLIADFANDDYVIIAGDFNAISSSEYDVFTAAGYSMANHGYIGDIATYPSSSPDEILDNIICKGFAINGIRNINDPDLSDHGCIYADLILL